MNPNNNEEEFKIFLYGWDDEDPIAEPLNIRKLDILLIEKSCNVAEPYEGMIKHFIPNNDLIVKPNLNIDITATPKQAMKLIKKHNYDIVFMSIGIPIEPWLEVVRELKEISTRNLHPHIPVIAITNCDPHSRDKCLAGGFDDILDSALLNPNHFLRTFRKFRLW